LDGEGSKSVVLLTGDRGVESGFLQRTVSLCTPSSSIKKSYNPSMAFPSMPRLRIVRTAATMRTHRYRRSILTLCDHWQCSTPMEGVASTLRQALADPGSGGIDFGAPADWLGFLDFYSKRRYAPLDLRNTGSSGSDGPHLPAGRMSRGPRSYRHQWRLTTLSISHCCTFAMA